jgi:tRNA (cytidine32/uridine32-2'-O)-methyltransferase
MEADARAAGARDILDAASLHATLADAIADCGLVLGCTARSRRVPLPEQVPREAAASALAEAAGGAEVAPVFGRERTGLENEELQLCHGAVHIPSDPDYGSLNLAAAVQVLAYELRMGWLAGADAATRSAAPAAVAPMPPAPASDERGQPAAHAQMEGFFAQLAETLDAIDFHKGRAPESAMRKLRRLFLRARPDVREVRLLRGILADAQRMARLAGKPGPGG